MRKHQISKKTRANNPHLALAAAVLVKASEDHADEPLPPDEQHGVRWWAHQAERLSSEVPPDLAEAILEPTPEPIPS
jgi:hypothetical protein